MDFLQHPNKKKRYFLQLQGFMSNTYLDVVEHLLEISIFKFPDIELSISLLENLEMPDYLRLGNRLERFFSFIIQQSDDYELLAENIQIFKNKITIGELDFIVFDKKSKQILHIELGGKLYLYDPNFKEELQRWIGPNRKDSLLKKMEKLRKKQFPLLYNSYTIKTLNSLDIDVKNILQQVSFKARLFMPYHLKNTIPKNVSKSNIKGYYVNLNVFLNETIFKFYYYFLPEKQDWIVAPKHGEIWFTFDEILPKIEISLLQKQSPMLWVKKFDDSYETIFVTWW